MAFTIQNNMPSAGCIQWSNLNMVYKGVSYSIQNGYTNAIYAYWTPSYPNNLVVDNTFPTLGADDCLIFLNKNGIATTVPTASVVPGDLIVPGSVTANAIAANTITGDQIAAGTIVAGNIATNAISSDKIAANAIGADKIAANTIIGDKLVADAITSREIASRTITANEILAGTITSNEIKAATITAGNIAANTITVDKLASSVGSSLDISSNTSIGLKANASDVYTKAQTDSAISNLRTMAKLNGIELLNLSYQKDLTALVKSFTVTIGTASIVAATEIGGNVNEPNLIKTINGTYLYSPFIACNPNGTQYMKISVYNQTTNVGTVYVQCCYYDKDKVQVATNEAALTLIGNVSNTSADTWQTHEGYLDPLASTDIRQKSVYMRIRILTRYNGQTGTTYLKDLSWKQLAPSTIADLENRLTSAEVKITPNAIVSTVRSDVNYTNDLGAKTDKTAIISTINQTAEAIKISASKVGISGAVTLSNWLDPGDNTKINGGSIKTNTITSNHIATTGILADKIIGGTLTLGGLNNVSGVITMKDATNAITGIMDNNGMQIMNGKLKIVDEFDVYYQYTDMEAAAISLYNANATGTMDESSRWSAQAIWLDVNNGGSAQWSWIYLGAADWDNPDADAYISWLKFGAGLRIQSKFGGGSVLISDGGIIEASGKIMTAGKEVAAISGDGVMEIAKYIDFHETTGTDFTARLQSNGSQLENPTGNFKATGYHGGTFNFDRFNNWDTFGIGSTGGGAGLTNDNGTYDALMILGNDSSGNGRTVKVWDILDVQGSLLESGLRTLRTANANPYKVFSTAVYCTSGAWVNVNWSFLGAGTVARIYHAPGDNVNVISRMRYPGLSSCDVCLQGTASGWIYVMVLAY